MPFELRFTPFFRKKFVGVMRAYSNSHNDVCTSIESLRDPSVLGDLYPGFCGLEIKKLRLPLKKYNIGRSSGLRYVTYTDLEKLVITPVLIYKKGDFRQESDVKAAILDAIKKVTAEMVAKQFSGTLIEPPPAQP